MRILLILAGIGLLSVGIFGITSGMFSFGPGFQEAINNAVEGPSAEALCKPGETLVEEGGQSEYTPGQGYGRSVAYYCEDSAGNRRDVTGDFASDLLGSVSTNLFGAPNLRVEYLAAAGLGLVLLLVGVFSGLRSKNVDVRPGVAVNAPFGGQAVTWTVPEGTRPTLAERIQQAGSTSNLADKLRELDIARGANLITEEEYQRMRQQILDSMA